MKLRKNVKLASFTYYKIGGNARYFCEIEDKNDLLWALKFAAKKRLPLFVLGEGSNVLVRDEGFEGLVIKIKNQKLKIKNPNKKSKNREDVYIEIGAGVLLRDLVVFSLKKGLKGLEWAAGIPGTTGGAVRGNAGAFGHSISEIVKDATVITGEGSREPKKALKKVPSSENQKNELKIKKLTKRELEFGYRTSFVKKKGGIILEITLRLKRVKDKKEKKKNKELVNYYLNYRKKHHPLEHPSCGSVFKNIQARELRKAKGRLGGIKGNEVPAALLIAKAGLAGRRIGRAQISEKHSNFIINLGGAKAKDVYELIKLCQQEVYKKFGVKLEPEVEMVGFVSHNT